MDELEKAEDIIQKLEARNAELVGFIVELERAAARCVDEKNSELIPKYWRDRARAALKTEADHG